MSKVDFDGVNRLITVKENVTQLNVKDDIYSEWKRWVVDEDNAKYYPAMRTIGGDPIGGGRYAGDIYFLINNWRLVVDLTQTKVVGALYSDDYDTAFFTSNLTPQYPVFVSALVSTIALPQNVVTGDVDTLAQQVTNMSIAVSAMQNEINNMKTNISLMQTQVIDLHHEAFGKWTLNPATNTLTLYKQNGDVLKTFSLTSTQVQVPTYIERIPQ